MEVQVLCAFFYHLLLPLSLVGACLFRYNALSLIYLLYLLLLPLFFGPSERSIRGHTGRLIKALLVTSILFLCAHTGFQIALYVLKDTDFLGYNCSRWETLSRHIGVTRLDLNDVPNCIRIIAPDFGIFLISCITLGFCNRLTKKNKSISDKGEESIESDEQDEEEGTEVDEATEDEEDATEDEEEATEQERRRQSRTATLAQLRVVAQKFLETMGKVVAVIFLALAGIAVPCGFSGVYFLLFIGICTWWACHLPMSHVGFNTICVMVGFYTAGHIICLYIYQTAFFQQMFPPSGLWSRLFGLKDIIHSNSSSPHQLILNEAHEWPVYVNPGILLLLYYTLATLLNCIVLLFHRGKKNCHLSLFEHFCVIYPHSTLSLQVWSITFHSWLTFVLLLWACLIWIVRSRRHFALLCSPFILLYGIVLCGLQYVWGMDLSEELPTKLGFMDLKQLGLVRAPYHCLRLGAVLLYTLTFWLLMRQFIKEKCIRRKDIPLKEVNIPEQDQGKSDLLKTLGEIVIQFYSKYWIYVCGGMFIVVSFAGRIVVYKIVYMFLFLLCLSFYQICYFLWRKLLKLFWWLVIAYTMLVLISVYTFQFADFPHYWKNFTGLTDEQLADLGLVQFSVGELFYSILIPGFFLLACILQLHYFHQHFMVITDLEHVPAKGTGYSCRCLILVLLLCKLATPFANSVTLSIAAVRSKWGLVFDRLLVLFLKSSEVLSRIKECVWQFLELHMVKLVALFSVWVAVREPSIMNFLFIVLWAFAVPYIKFRSMASCISTMWACIIIVCKMLYQLNIVNPEEYSNNCTMSFPNETNLKPEEIALSTLYREPVDPANWFGFKKTSPLLPYIKNHLVLLTLLVFEVTVYRHQQHFRKRDQLSSPLVHLIFQDITRQDLDKGLVSCAKYFINFFFHKFGLEICLLMIVNVIGQRMNFLMLFHSCWLVAILTRRKRAMIAKLWPKYCLFQSLFLMYQYLLCVGMPPALCLDYPWRWAAPITINSNLIKWLFLPDFVTLPNATHLMYDFLLLVCASQQWQVFRNEKKEEMIIAAGENTDDSDPMVGREQNPVPNFINCRSYLDMLKVVVFRYIFWLVLAVVFATGSTRISVFGGGYLLASFYLLLFGRKLLMKPAGNYLNLWDCLIMYNVMVIISKNMLSLLACVFLKQLQSNFCWLIQLFSLHCTIKGYYNELQHKDCSLAIGEAGIIWDSICFFFLLLQRRIFLSYYFIHVAADLRASTLQASRYSTIGSTIGGRAFSHCRPPPPHQTLDHSSSILPPSLLLPHFQKLTLVSFSPNCSVLQSGEYYLFESDSEEEDESVLDEQKPHKQIWAIVCWFGHKECWCSLVFNSNDHLCLFHHLAKSNVVQRVMDILRFLGILFLVMVTGLTQWLNTLVKPYIDTSTILWRERYVLIQKLEEQEDVQSIQDGEEIPVLDPDNETHACTEGQKLDMDPPESVRPSKELDVYLIIRTRTASELLANRYVNFCIQELKDSEKFYDSQNRCLKLVYAVYNVIAANSELTCYFIIILNNMISASVISLFLPILIFLWGMLSIPRPSKRFWMVAIVYTEIMILVKYIFQFGFFPWNSFYIISFFEDKPFFPPRILGLYKSDDYLKYDLIQLLALLFHQSLLKVRRKYVDSDICRVLRIMVRFPGVKIPSPKQINNPQTVCGTQLHAITCHVLPTKIFSQSTSQYILKKLIEFGKKVKNFLISIAMSIYTPLKSFFSSILHTKYRAATDVYALMFLADVVDFVIIIFGFWAFGKHSAAADIASSLSDDQVPEGFLVMVLIQFSTMVIDRALYLRKTVLGKLIFQVLLVFGIHVWMFFILPAVSERMFSHNIVVQLWYFVKCIYFALSAYQIRCGYPTRILGNFLTKKYNHLNLFLFQGFRLVPFLVELRAVMDWVWTDTTLSLSSWMSVEDIYANIFIIKCSRETEKRYPQPKGKKKKKIVKYGMGGLIIAFLICVIWFPLLFMSLVKSVVGVVNHPIDVTVTVKLGGYEPLFTMSAQQHSLIKIVSFQFLQAAMQFITLYSYEDIITAHVEGNSGSLWNISPPSRKFPTTFLMHFYGLIKSIIFWSFFVCRDLTLGGTVEHSSDKHIINLSPEDPVREQLANLLQGNRKEYIQLDANKTDSILEWWVIKTKSKECKQHACNELQMVIFSDKVSPPSLGLLAGYGIMGLYVSIVLVVGKFVREFFSDISHSIMFEELPCVDRVLKLCHDIFLVRENGEFELEEELFAKLIFLYRSPETMIKWTRED
uniref:Piezo type mechanosensitive ion channel component 1 (Er blood group) n=1 Tax=Callorhinchus milii TaxID=7868 RepID=A0A4W3IZH5_CALMI